jgi:hypothetical protein
MCLAAGVACGDDEGPMEVEEPDPEPLAPVDLVDDSTYGRVEFADGNTVDGGQGEEISGISCVSTIVAHYHAHLSLFVEGERIAIPRAVGVTQPLVSSRGIVYDGDCFYWMHTHDATGLVHIEPPVIEDRTLGEFFDVWGMELSEDNVAGFEGELSIFVNGERYEGDPREIVLKSQMHVSLQVGRPLSPPPLYNFFG